MPNREPVLVSLCFAAFLLVLAGTAAGQVLPTPDEPPLKAQQRPRESATPLKPPKLPAQDHAFWNRTNQGLFAGVAAVRAMDYASTRHFRARGANEILLSNATVDNKPLFAGIEVAGVAVSITTSYVFHRTGHHKLERWVSIVHIGVGTFGDARNYTLSGPNPNP